MFLLNNPLLVSFIAAAFSLFYAGLLALRVLSAQKGSDAMQSIAKAIQEGSSAFLIKQYKTVSVVAIFIVVALAISPLGINAAFAFAVGATASALAGILGMLIAVRANVRVAFSAKKGLSSAFELAFKGGAVTGFTVVGLALFSLVFILWMFGIDDLTPLIALGFGGSLISVFARLGGGIYTKAADIGADLVGKMEAGIPEDDSRNPAVIADNVGDNVGDDAGMAADLFETYVVTVVAAMLVITATNPDLVFVPLLLGAVAVFASIVASFMVRISSFSKKMLSWLCGKDEAGNIMGALYTGLFSSAILASIGFLFVIQDIGLRISAFIGIGVTLAIVLITEYYTSKRFRPVRAIAHSSSLGRSTNIITGLAYGMEATTLPVLVIIGGTLAAFWVGGLIGIAIAVAAMLSLAGMIIALDAFGPITDNAGGIAKMSELAPDVRKVTDQLDAVGNTTKAVTKGYAIASAGLAALVLFAAYMGEFVEGDKLNFMLNNPNVIVGLLAGAAVPYLFAAFAMRAVGKAAGSVVEEVRRQFREIPGIMERTAKPEYGRAVSIVTDSALRGMVVPALLPVLIPIAVWFLLGPEALGGALIGVIVTGLFVAISMTSGGAAWDNAKKYIEEGNHGGMGSEAHKAAILGDTVGDPYKDTAGPAINPVIKVMNIVALLLARFF